jgi:hypothetical protein
MAEWVNKESKEKAEAMTKAVLVIRPGLSGYVSPAQ